MMVEDRRLPAERSGELAGAVSLRGRVAVVVMMTSCSRI